MAVLETLIDPSGVLTGGAAARAELDKVIRKGNEVSDSLGKISQTTTVTGASMRDAFGAAKGGLQVSQGLQQVVSGLEGAISGAQGLTGAANAAGRVLLEISRTAGEWRNLSTAMATTRTVSQEVVRDSNGLAIGMREVVETSRSAQSGLGVLWGVLKANPITAVATALGVAATAMSLFGENTSKAATEWEQLGAAMDRARLDERAARELGADVGGPQGRQLSNLLSGYTQVISGGNLSLGEIARASGLGQADLARYLAQQGSQRARDYVQTGSYIQSTRRSREFGSQDIYSSDPSGLIFTQEQAREVFRRAYEFERGRFATEQAYSTALSGYQRSAPQPGIYSAGYEGQVYGPAYDDQAQASVLFHEQQIQQADKAMDDLIRKGQEFGDTIGDAFFGIVSGATSARQALAGLLAEFARSASRQAFSSLFGSVFGGFGATPGQSQSFTPMEP